MRVVEWPLIPDFITAIGLLCDIIGFLILAKDVFAGFRGERSAWERVADIKEASFRRRYGVFAPDKKKRDAELEQFLSNLSNEMEGFHNEMDVREWRVSLGIRLVVFGFSLQLIGVMPIWDRF